MDVVDERKWCNWGKHWAGVENFGKNRAQPDGLQTTCRECRKAYYVNNRDKMAAQKAGSYIRNREKALARAKERYEENKEQKAEYDRRYYAKHKERKQRYLKEWGKRNRAKKNAAERRRRARKSGCEEHHTAEEFQDLCDLYGNLCLTCRESGKALTRDHVVPLSSGGSDCIGNIQPLCHSCNSWKGLRTLDFRED